MAHLVTGYAGREHIQSADAGAFNASFFGHGQYVMESGRQFEGHIIDNNTVRIYDGDLLMYGRHIRLANNTYEDLTITTGTAGKNRIDVICMTYEKNTVNGTEKAFLEVIEGKATEGTAAAPECTDGNILNGAILNQMPLYRVKIEGVVCSGITAVFQVIPTYKTLAEKYEAEFMEVCKNHLESLNVFDTVEEIKENQKENQLAGALALKEHIENQNNPHGVTKKDVGLGKADNTSDSEKTVKYAQGATNDSNGNKICETYLPLTGGNLTGGLRIKEKAVVGEYDEYGFFQLKSKDDSVWEMSSLGNANGCFYILYHPTGKMIALTKDGEAQATSFFTAAGKAQISEGSGYGELQLRTVDGQTWKITPYGSTDALLINNLSTGKSAWIAKDGGAVATRFDTPTGKARLADGGGDNPFGMLVLRPVGTNYYWMIYCDGINDNCLRILKSGASTGAVIKEDGTIGAPAFEGTTYWDSIANKPAAYPPSEHTHNYLPLAGGTMSGDISFGDNYGCIRKITHMNSSGTTTLGTGLNIVSKYEVRFSSANGGALVGTRAKHFSANDTTYADGAIQTTHNGGYLNLQADAQIQCRNYNDTAWVPIAASGYPNQSSRKYKKNIQDISEEQARSLLDYRVVTYDYIEESSGKNCMGLIAEEVADICEWPVFRNSDGEPDGLDYSRFVPQLIRMVQLQQEEINSLKDRLEKVEQKITE